MARVVEQVRHFQNARFIAEVVSLGLIVSRGIGDELLVPQLRHVSSPAAVSTGTPSLLRKVRASAASRFPIQCETLSLLRKAMAVREAAV